MQYELAFTNLREFTGHVFSGIANPLLEWSQQKKIAGECMSH